MPLKGKAGGFLVSALLKPACYNFISIKKVKLSPGG
jgi:hypothetical protein